jgi:Na+/alanine symporter
MGQTDFFKDVKITYTHYYGKIGTVNVPFIKCHTVKHNYNDTIKYIIVLREGLTKFTSSYLYAYYYGNENIHYLSFESKEKANKEVQKLIDTLKK